VPKENEARYVFIYKEADGGKREKSTLSSAHKLRFIFSRQEKKIKKQKKFFLLKSYKKN
jgi:hypothetical protein